jgi:hypothetical protein
MIGDEYFVGMSESQLFADETSRYDVLIVHNDLDVLLATCTIEADNAMRNFLKR